MIKFITITILSVFFVLAAPFQYVFLKENNSQSRYAKDHFIVKMKREPFSAAGFSPLYDRRIQLKEIAEGLGVVVTKVKSLFPRSKNKSAIYEKYELGEFYILFIEPGKDITKLCTDISQNHSIDFAEPDFIGEASGKKDGLVRMNLPPNDTYFDRQWALNNDGTTKPTYGKNSKVGADMNVLKGWEVATGSEEIIVAVLDSGVKLDHPDLNDRIWINKNETRNGKDDDGNGFIDDTFGWNFAYDNNNVKDDGGHGTNICGTIGASTNNNLGYAGLDQHCRIMVCKNLDDENTGEYSWWSASLYYAANNGARIINMSEGGYDYSRTLATAVNYAYDNGCLIVASMMNKNNNDNYYPACLPNIMAIGATDTDDNRCRQFTWGGGSNWGKHISVVAPGNKIYGLDYKDNYNYDVYWSGTSQATAYVSGLASLLLSQDKSRTNIELREIIISTAKDQVGDNREDKQGWDEYYGYGRVDVYSALTNDKSGKDNRETYQKQKEYKDSKDRDDRDDIDKDRDIKDRDDTNSDKKNAKAVDRNSDSNSKDGDDDKQAKKVDR